MHDMLKSAPREWYPNIERSITGWGRHRDIVARFGRFPHRNAILGRASTEEERAFMEDGRRKFRSGTTVRVIAGSYADNAFVTKLLARNCRGKRKSLRLPSIAPLQQANGMAVSGFIGKLRRQIE